ncbi:MAG: hypothetical protein QXV69_10095 [Sulfolobaceae archaeon]
MKRYLVLEPWGVYVPFIYLSVVYWLLGGFGLFSFGINHPLFMMLGAYSFYFGMLQRLFVPAKKYLPFHIASFIVLLYPSYFSALISSIIVSICLYKSIYDLLKISNGKLNFPLNFLVLSSPLLSAVSWYLFPINPYYTIPPLIAYILGVNIGVFTAVLGARPFFGVRQIPFLLLVVLSYFFPFLIPIIFIVYFIFLFRRGISASFTPLLMVTSSLVILFSSYFTHEIIHSFTIGIMTQYFFSCSVYSLARYNYKKLYLISIFAFLSYFIRFMNLPASGLFWMASVLVYLYLVKDAMGIHGIKYGNSKVFGI